MPSTLQNDMLIHQLGGVESHSSAVETCPRTRVARVTTVITQVPLEGGARRADVGARRTRSVGETAITA